MARLKLDVPKSFPFSTSITLRVTDINYGGHMGNDSLLGIMHEARIRFFKQYQCTEMDVFGVSMIMSDVAIQYKAEGYHADELRIEMTAYDFSPTSFDLFYYITRVADQKVIALAKTNMVCYDYTAKKIKDVPAPFRQLFS